MSSYPILLTGANKISNNQYKYNFPSSVDLSEYDIAQSILMQCSVVQNPLALSNQTLHMFTSAGFQYGSLIVSSPAEYNWVPVNGTVSEMVITFTDQSYRPLDIVDTQYTIKLLLKPKKENP